MARIYRDGELLLPEQIVQLTARQASLIVGLARCRVTGPEGSPADDWRDLAATLTGLGVEPWDPSDPTSDATIYYPDPDDGLLDQNISDENAATARTNEGKHHAGP